MKKKLLMGLLVGILTLITIGIAHSANLKKTQVSQLYVSIFGRASEGEGNAYWCANQSDMVTAADNMLATDAAQTYFGSTLYDNQKFIEFIYENTLGKTYAQDPDGINYWVSELANGKSKGKVIATLINAAMDHQWEGLPSQTRFINKVAICNYTADVITSVPDVNNLSVFVEFISNVTDDDDSTKSARSLIHRDGVDDNKNLTNRPPVPVGDPTDSNPNYYVTPGEKVVLDATQSYDPDEIYGDKIVLWEWDLNNDGEYDGEDDASGETYSFLVPEEWEPGSEHSVSLRVTDDGTWASECGGIPSLTGEQAIILAVSSGFDCSTAEPNISKLWPPNHKMVDIRIVGVVSSALSNIFGLQRPLFEPSLYGLYSVSRNLDLSSKKLQRLFTEHGEEFVNKQTGLPCAYKNLCSCRPSR